MNYKTILTNFKKELEARTPPGIALTRMVGEILDIDRMGAYRRVNGIVQFNLSEVAIICQQLNINPEKVMNLNPRKSLPFKMQMPDYYNFNAEDEQLHDQIIKLLGKAVKDNNAVCVAGYNSIPHGVITDYDLILRFMLCKWLYFSSGNARAVPFSEIRLPPLLVESKKKIRDTISRCRKTITVWDKNIIRSFIDDLEYFFDIGVVTAQEVSDIKSDLSDYLDEMEMIAATGTYPGRGNQFELYISSVWIDTNYTFLESEQIKLSMFQAFILNQAWSNDIDSFERVKAWTTSLVRCSTLVSRSGESARRSFFNEQRELLR